MQHPVGAVGLECLMDRANIHFTSGYRFSGSIDVERLRESFLAIVKAVEKFAHRLRFMAQDDFAWQPVDGAADPFRVLYSDDLDRDFGELCRHSLIAGEGDDHQPMRLTVLLSTRGDREFLLAQTSEHTYLDARSAEFLFNSVVEHYNATLRGDAPRQEAILDQVRRVRTADSAEILNLLGLDDATHDGNMRALADYPVADPGCHAIPLEEVPACLTDYRKQRFAPIIRHLPFAELRAHCRARYPEVSQNSIICAALAKGFYEANRREKDLPERQTISFKMLSDLLSPELRTRYIGNYIAFVPVSVSGDQPVEEIAKQIHERVREFKTKKIDVSLFRAVEEAVQESAVGTVDEPLSFVVTNWNNHRFLRTEDFLHGASPLRHQSGVNIDPRDVLGAVLVNRPILVINHSRQDEVCLSFFPSLRAEAENLELADYIGAVFR